jgi:hypothetical protein
MTKNINMISTLENQKTIENLRETVMRFVNNAASCRTIGMSDDLSKTTRLMEILYHKSVQKELTQDQEKTLHAAILDHKRGLDFIEYDCECMKGKEKK